MRPHFWDFRIIHGDILVFRCVIVRDKLYVAIISRVVIAGMGQEYESSSLDVVSNLVSQSYIVIHVEDDTKQVSDDVRFGGPLFFEIKLVGHRIPH